MPFIDLKSMATERQGTLMPFHFAGMLIMLVGLCGCGAKQTPGEPATSNRIVVASEVSFPPMEFIDDSGKMVGFDLDLIRAVAEKAGLKAEIQNVAWEGIFGMLKSNTADVVASSVTITDERKAQYDFTQPYMKSGLVVVVRAEDKDKYPDLASLKGKKVGAQIGTTAADRISTEPVEVKLYNSAGLVFIDLANGNLDGMMMDKPVADYYSARKPEFAKKLHVAEKMYADESLGFVVRKGNRELLDKLNAGLDAVKKDGTYEKIQANWFK
jgi:polar amino acid transport system substrate-binding protein